MSINIVFMGTPDFAVPCLEKLIENQYNITAVFSQPDRPAGRGYRVVPPPVKVLALKHNIPVFQPEKLKDSGVLESLIKLSPDLIVVVAYGQILPKAILELPRLGCINVHASLLPQLRGAAPIQWSILNGDSVTGVTTMYMDVGLDTGDIILQKETIIEDEETSGQLFNRLAPMGAELLVDTIPLLVEGTAPRTKQDDSKSTLAPIIKKSMACLDFNLSPKEFCNKVRGFHPWPLAFTMLDDLRLTVHSAAVAEGYSGTPGQVLDAKDLIVACGSGAVQLFMVQPQGRKIVSGSDFSNGRRMIGGEKFISP